MYAIAPEPGKSGTQSEVVGQPGSLEGSSGVTQEEDFLDDVDVPIPGSVDAGIGHGEQLQTTLDEDKDVDDWVVVEDKNEAEAEDVDREYVERIDGWEEVEHDDGYGDNDGDDF